MKDALTLLQIIFSIALIGLILIQARGTGLGRSQAGSFSRRGLEKLLFKLTFAVATIFLTVSVLQLYA
ncbi:MAG: preprotein translocase subunit SecG [Patescibacteria group bacterium]